MSTRKLASASLANLLIPLSGILVSPFLSRELGPEGRGLYAALSLPIVVCGWFGTYGLQDALTFHLRNGSMSRKAAAKVSLLATVPLGLLGIGLLALLGLFVFGDAPGHYREYLSLALLAPLHILANLLIGALTGASDICGVNLVKVVPALLRTVIVIAACLVFDLSAYVAGLLFLASVVGGLVVGLARLRAAPAQGEPDPPGSAIPIGSLVRYSLLCLPGVLTAISAARLDQIIGLPLIGAQELGYYAVAVSVAEIPMVIATAARTVLMGRPATSDPRAATRVARVAVLASVLACGVLAGTAGLAVPLVFGRAFAPAIGPTVILCAATVLYTCMVIFGAVLLAHGRAGWSSTALVTGCAAGIGLLVLLAPRGAVGAAIASLCGYGVSAAVAARAVRGVAGVVSLRMLTVPYREDLDSLAAEVRGSPVARWVSRVGVETCAVGALFVLAWLRVLVPQMIQLFTSGRPEFNSRDDMAPAASDIVGEALSLAFILLAAFLVARGIRAGTTGRLWWLAGCVAPLLAIELSSLLAREVPSVVSIALPLAAVAIWLQPPGPRVLAVIGTISAATAAISIVLALVRPDLALLSGDDAGDKTMILGGLLAGPYLHSNVLGIVLTLSAPFIFCIRPRLVRLCSLAVVLFALFWTGSRASQLATAAMLVTYGCYLFLRHGRQRLWLVSASIVTGVTLIVLVPLVTRDPDGFTERGRIWKFLLDRWTERPIVGLGPKYFEREELAAALGGAFNHGHNILVQLLTIGGLLTVVLFALLLYLAWRQAVRLAQRWGLAVPALFLVAFTHVSWLEASQMSTTLAGFLAWLPLILIARLGLAGDARPGLADDPIPQPVVRRADWGTEVGGDRVAPAPESQKTATSRM
jgi:O-antigen/teichoic acid export membrane protein